MSRSPSKKSTSASSSSRSPEKKKKTTPTKSKPKSKPKSKKAPTHPTYGDMITDAILEEKKWAKGTSRQAIVKYIQQNYDIPEKKVRRYVGTALRRMVEDGELIQVNRMSYKLASKSKSKGSKSTKSSKKKVTRKTRKVVRRKGEPKKPLTAYLLFANKVRPEIKKKNPDAGFGDLSKLVAKKWAKAPSSVKKEYEAEYEKEKKKYEKVLKAFNAKNKESSEEDSSSTQSEEDSSSSSEESKPVKYTKKK